MEDPAVDGKIEEYSSEHNTGRMSWIMNKGFGLGKKILVTGFVISSAPLVLPPLVIISAIGIAFSVPYGLLFASYVCTEKLMSKFLPRPTPPLLLEYGTVYDDEEEIVHDEIEGGQDMENKGDINMGKEEEEELMEDVRGEADMRIDKRDEGNTLVAADYGKGRAEKEENKLERNLDETAKENEYEEDVGEYLDKDEEKLPEEIEVKIEPMREEEQKEPVIGKSRDDQPADEVRAIFIDMEGDEKTATNIQDNETPFEVTNIAVELYQGTGIEEDEELVTETRGLIERNRDEGKTDNVVEKDKQSEIERKIEENRSEETQEIGHVEYVDTVSKEVNPSKEVQGLSEKKETTISLEEKKSIGKINETKNHCSIVEEEQKPVLDSSTEVQGGKADNSAGNSNKQNVQLIRDKEIVIPPNANAGENDEGGGVDLLDGKNESCANYDTPEGEHVSNHARISSERGTSMASNEVLYGEEKIWEQIDAMRMIVGYKAARHATCIEELKALYLFTGVEPPALFKDPSDLVEVSDKLRFLMSIVGVK